MRRMPVLFVGHGSPMNAIEENEYTREWKKVGNKLPKPQAILSVSAHWFTSGTRITDSPAPRTIHDMYGFPDELYKIVYQAPGSPRFAQAAKNLLGETAAIDNSWGFDHGTWSVLHRIYPKADIPVFQLSVDAKASPEWHFQLGRALASLREQGVLIFGSGNVVHNLARVNWEAKEGYSWAEDFDGYIKSRVLSRNYESVLSFRQAGAPASLAVPSMDHFAPLLYVLGASDEKDSVLVFNDSCVLGSLSMTSYLFD